MAYRTHYGDWFQPTPTREGRGDARELVTANSLTEAFQPTPTREGRGDLFGINAVITGRVSTHPDP